MSGRTKTVALALILTVTAGLATQAQAKRQPRGWLYVHKYLSDRQRKHWGGIASAPVFVFTEAGALLQGPEPDGSQPLGKLIPVEPGVYYVAAGKFNIGLTRQKYVVKPRMVTVIQTGFVKVETWPESEQPKEGCSNWDAEMTLFARKGDEWLPVFSNSRLEFDTRHLGMIQMLVGKYRVSWHGFETDVEIKAGQVYALPLGTVGPLADPKGLVGLERKEGAHALRLCDDGPTHIIAGKYWVSYVKPLETYPYEQRVWQQVEVPPYGEHGYVKKLPGERIGRPVFTGKESQPIPAPQTGEPGAASQDDPLGGEIDWNAPP